MHARHGRTRSTSPSQTAPQLPSSVATDYVDENGGDLAATEAIVLRLMSLGTKIRGVAWKDMTVSEQIASLISADRNVVATMAYSWHHGDGTGLTNIISQQTEDDLRLMAYTLRIPLPSNAKKLSSKNLNSLRLAIVDRIAKEAQEHPNVSGVDEIGDRMQELRTTPPEKGPPSPTTAPTETETEFQTYVASSSSVNHAKNAINLAFQIPPVSDHLPSVTATTEIAAAPIRTTSSRPATRSVTYTTFPVQQTTVPPMTVTLNPPISSSSRPSLYHHAELYPSDESEEDELEEDSPDPAYRDGRMNSRELKRELMRSGVGLDFATEWIENAHKVSGNHGPTPINDLYRLQKIPDYQQRKLRYMNMHTKEEMLALTRIIDALVRRDINEALEHATRRLGGLETAILTGNFEVCSKLTTSYEMNNFVPKFFLASALKAVHREQAIKKSASSSSSSSSSGQYSESGSGYSTSRGGRRYRDESYSSQRNQGSEYNRNNSRGTSAQRTPSASGSRSSSGRGPARS